MANSLVPHEVGWCSGPAPAERPRPRACVSVCVCPYVGAFLLSGWELQYSQCQVQHHQGRRCPRRLCHRRQGESRSSSNNSNSGGGGSRSSFSSRLAAVSAAAAASATTTTTTVCTPRHPAKVLATGRQAWSHHMCNVFTRLTCVVNRLPRCMQAILDGAANIHCRNIPPQTCGSSIRDIRHHIHP
jgi:hypothetical protein